MARLVGYHRYNPINLFPPKQRKRWPVLVRNKIYGIWRASNLRQTHISEDCMGRAGSPVLFNYLKYPSNEEMKRIAGLQKFRVCNQVLGSTETYALSRVLLRELRLLEVFPQRVFGKPRKTSSLSWNQHDTQHVDVCEFGYGWLMVQKSPTTTWDVKARKW